MKAIKDFNDFIENGIVKRQSPDKSRAEFLIKQAEHSYLFLQDVINKIRINETNANDIMKSCYDILMELVRAKMILKGYNAAGQGAHEAEVSYLRMLDFNENDVQFADQVRFFRNGMLYYGKFIDKEYAEKALEFFNRIYPLLKEIK